MFRLFGRRAATTPPQPLDTEPEVEAVAEGGRGTAAAEGPKPAAATPSALVGIDDCSYHDDDGVHLLI